MVVRMARGFARLEFPSTYTMVRDSLHKYRMKRAYSKNGFHQEASHSPVVHVGWIGLTFHGWRPTQSFSSVSRPFLHGTTSFSPQGRCMRSIRQCKWFAELLSKDKAKASSY